MARDERFRLLKKRFHRLALAIAVSFLGWYFLYVGLSAFARGFMAEPVAGEINVALLLGVLQFVTTFLLAWVYVAYARRMLDPLAAELRAEADGVEADRAAEGGTAGVPQRRPEAAATAERRESWPAAQIRADLRGGLR
ncbi:MULTISPECIES: DUF485 domain-containing protein [Actinomadura]|uniref:DUF485 domain-containing protein n=1 Tax=Actinomadura yumaensis TaxID=111807 RepID=A0ABW2CFM6_9ACTN|nr:DUF485 domain-containing protein [Actinomadura sp. J1-007]